LLFKKLPCVLSRMQSSPCWSCSSWDSPTKDFSQANNNLSRFVALDLQWLVLYLIPPCLLLPPSMKSFNRVMGTRLCHVNLGSHPNRFTVDKTMWLCSPEKKIFTALTCIPRTANLSLGSTNGMVLNTCRLLSWEFPYWYLKCLHNSQWVVQLCIDQLSSQYQEIWKGFGDLGRAGVNHTRIFPPHNWCPPSLQ
jgi:hypothetical protein